MIFAVNNKFVELQKISNNLLSVLWKFFLFTLENPNCVPHYNYFDCPKTDSCQNDSILKELETINN